MKNYNPDSLIIYRNPKSFKLIIIIYLLIVSLLIFWCFSSKIYSKKIYKGIIKKDQIVVPINVLDSNKVLKSSYIKVNDKKYNLNIKNVGNIYYEDNINIQDIIISFTNKKYYENQVVDVYFYYENDYVFKKILKGVMK